MRVSKINVFYEYIIEFKRRISGEINKSLYAKYEEKIHIMNFLHVHTKIDIPETSCRLVCSLKEFDQVKIMF